MKLPIFYSHRVILTSIAALVFTCSALLTGATTVALLWPRSTAPTLVRIFPRAITLDDTTFLAKSVLLYDPRDARVLYAKDAYEAHPLASLTKLMAAQVVLSQKVRPTAVTVTVNDLKPEGDWGFRSGDVFSLKDLLKYSLVASSNDAITAAVSTVGPDFVQIMNTEAQSLGLTKTRFINPTGLDVDATTAGGYGSAFDMARLTAVFYKNFPTYFTLTNAKRVSIRDGARTLSATATAAPLLTLPGFVGAKTGYTTLAGGNLVAVFDIEVGHPLVAVILGSTQNGRFTDMETLITAARAQNN